MPPEEVQGVLGRAFSDFARDIDTAKTHLSRLAEGSVIVGAVRGMRPEDQAALATSMVPGVGDAAGLYADYTDIRENWDQVPWYDKAGMVGAAALGAVPFVPSRSQVNAGAEVAREKIKAYHGSPHDFDKFTTEAIGTGEGAQAYGHGLYFAEAEDVARGYRNALQSPEIVVDMDNPVRQQVAKRINSKMQGNALRRATLDDAIKGAETDLRKEIVSGGQGAQDRLRELKAMRMEGIELGNSGSMYQVEIDASPDEFLDWNLPLSEQSEQVKKAIGLDRSLLGEDLSKEAIYEYMKKTSGVDNSNLAEGISRFHLGEKNYLSGVRGEALAPVDAEELGSIVAAPQGIKGIRYKDANSRGKEGGTSNYVVFDENLISIARKYGIAIPAAAAMLARQTGQNPQDMYEDDST